MLSRHDTGGAEGLTGESILSRGGGEPDFEGAVGGDVPDVEEPLLEP